MWGAHLYTSVLTQYNTQKGRTGTAARPIMLGISDADHAASHRYPVWWTGDDKSLGYSLNRGCRIIILLIAQSAGGVCKS